MQSAAESFSLNQQGRPSQPREFSACGFLNQAFMTSVSEWASRLFKAWKLHTVIHPPCQQSRKQCNRSLELESILKQYSTLPATISS
jgi:hypothetical protein